MKTIRLLVVAVLMASIVWGTMPAGSSSAAQAPGSAPPAMKPQVLRYSGANPPAHHSSIVQRWFADQLEKRTNKLITVEVYQSAELYKHREAVDAVINGAVEMAYCSGGHWGGRTPLFGFYNYVGMLEDMDHYHRSVDQLYALLDPYFEKQGVKLIHFIGYGHNAYAGKKKVLLPSDLKGMMIRGQNSAFNAFLKAMGATTARMSSAEVYDAMAKGALDGSVSGWSTVRTEKWPEIVHYYTSPINCGVFVTFMNLKKWKSIPEYYQKIILDVGKAAQKISFELAVADDAKGIEYAKTKADVTILNRQQLAKWQEAGRGTWKLWLDACDKRGVGDAARKLMNILDSTR